MQSGMWLGCVTFGFISDALGRKKVYVAYLAHTNWSLLLLGPLVGFFGTGNFTGFGVITSELFPTSLRTFAMGLTYNFGRAPSAAAPLIIGALAAWQGFGSAFWRSGMGFFAAGLLALLLPEKADHALA